MWLGKAARVGLGRIRYVLAGLARQVLVRFGFCGSSGELGQGPAGFGSHGEVWSVPVRPVEAL